MVVYFTINTENMLAVGRDERLTATQWVDDAETLVTQDGSLACIDSAPVGSAMAQLLRHLERLGAQFLGLFLDVEDCYDSAHSVISLGSYQFVRLSCVRLR